jgi:hypothetical protein
VSLSVVALSCDWALVSGDCESDRDRKKGQLQGAEKKGRVLMEFLGEWSYGVFSFWQGFTRTMFDVWIEKSKADLASRMFEMRKGYGAMEKAFTQKSMWWEVLLQWTCPIRRRERSTAMKELQMQTNGLRKAARTRTQGREKERYYVLVVYSLWKISRMLLSQYLA